MLLRPKCGAGTGTGAATSSSLLAAAFAAAMQVQVQPGAAIAPVPWAPIAPVLIVPNGAELTAAATAEVCAPTTPPPSPPPARLSAVVPDGTDTTAEFAVATVASVELALAPLPPLPPAVLVAPAPAPASADPLGPAAPIVLFNEMLIVQEVAAPSPSSWHVTGWLGFGGQVSIIKLVR